MENRINEIEKIFSETQIMTIKKILTEGFWGDCDMTFEDGKEYGANGYTTNLGTDRAWSGILSGISKTIKASGTNLICMCSDWWGDGSKDGDMMFFNYELLASRRELKEWAKS